MEATLNAWTIIFLLAALHGLALSLFFLARKEGRGSSNKFLGLFLLLFSLTLIDHIGYWTRYQLVYPHLLNLSSTFVFLFGPGLYLYVTSVLKPAKVFRIRNLVHFLPFLVFMGFMLPYYFQPGAAKLELIDQTQDLRGLSSRSAGIVFAKTAHLLSYSLLILFYTKFRIFRNKIRNNDFSSDDGRWLSIISYNFLGFSICFALFYLLVATIDGRIEYDYLIWLAMTGFIFSIGYAGYQNGDLLPAGNDAVNYNGKTNISVRIARRYEKDLLTYMDLEKPYRDGELRLHDLARELSLSPDHLSRVLNDRMGKNFFEFITAYRVREAQKILSDPSKSDYDVLRVAFESGFSNKSSLVKAFKEEMGITPSEYRSRELGIR